MTNVDQNIGRFLAGNASKVFRAYEESDKSPIRTWEKLESDFPTIVTICDYSDFEHYLPIVVTMQEKYRHLEEENQKLQEQIANLRGKGEARNIGGWTLRRHKAGYYMLQKSIKGKVQTIYIGKEVDEDEARRKISEKTEKLRQAGIID